MATEMPVTVVQCAGCEKDLNVLEPYLAVLVRPKRDVIVSEEVASADPNEVADNNVYLGTKSGRAVLVNFHDFSCLATWVNARKDLKPKLEFHKEKKVYVPEDNPDEKEIAKREAASKAGDN